MLLADPIVPSLNALDEAGRARYCLDMIRAGDALLAVTGAARINYETLANEPRLHTSIVPGTLKSQTEKRTLPPMLAYPWALSRPYDATRDRPTLEALRALV